MTVDPLVLVTEVDRATARLLRTARALADEQLSQPSRLPGWTRGHVLTHLARNADGCTNLLTWARTGVETRQYPSWDQRERDIEGGAGRPRAVLLDDLRTSAERFATAAYDLPPQAWSATIEWTNGRRAAAASVVWARLREVEVHHVDLDAGYTPRDWPAAFVHRLLHEQAADLRDAPDTPALRLHADDLGHDLTIGADKHAPTVTGPGYALASWLAGRSPGDDLTVSPAGPLPPVPTWK